MGLRCRQASPELSIPLPQSPDCLDYRQEPLCLASLTFLSNGPTHGSDFLQPDSAAWGHLLPVFREMQLFSFETLPLICGSYTTIN
jgi:hypothetical protein